MPPLPLKNKSIITLSDTHGRHRELRIPHCDFLIHCGDICNDGNDLEITDFFDWFSKMPAKYKLFISGNHDYPFVFDPEEALKLIPENVILLEDKLKTIGGISFYGLRTQVNLFALPEIPSVAIDFLITHVPPKSILDDSLGCPFLLKFAKQQQPKYHIFGHVHKFANQMKRIGETSFMNVCCFGE